jgi:hypothetical protein
VGGPWAPRLWAVRLALVPNRTLDHNVPMSWSYGPSAPHDKSGEQPTTHGSAAQAIARAQHLVDCGPESADRLTWHVEAVHVGDLPAIGALLLSELAPEKHGLTP